MAKKAEAAEAAEAAVDDATVEEAVVAEAPATTDPGYEAVTLSDGTTYYRVPDGSAGSFDEDTIKRIVAAVRLRANNYLA